MKLTAQGKAEDEALDLRIKSDLILLRFKIGWNMQQIADEYEFRLHFVENVIREALR